MSADRVAQIIFYNNPDNYPPIINGVRLLAEAGWRVEVLCRADGRDWGVTYPKAVKLKRLDTRGGSSWREYMGFVAGALRHGSRKPSVLIGHDMHGLLPARLLATHFRRPLVYHCHDFAESSAEMPLGSRVVKSFERRFARTADAVVVPDKLRGEVIAKELRLKGEPIVAANAPLRSSQSSGEGLRRALAERGRGSEKILLRQGRVGRGHAIEPTLRSIPLWANKDWTFVVMGIGEPDYLRHLDEEARRLGVERQFVILPPVGYDEVFNFTSGADAGHALYEPIHINNVHITTASNKIMEYMSAGLPLLVSDTPALRGLVEKYVCGMSADERSPESIAAAVNTLLGDAGRARRLGAAARRAFEEVFCYELQFEPVLNALGTLV